MRDLRNNFHSLEAWLAEGEIIRIEKRGIPVALLKPFDATGVSKTTRARPDVRARLNAIWGDRCFTAEEVKAMRDCELEGEEG